jgi:hypothetical protein
MKASRFLALEPRLLRPGAIGDRLVVLAVSSTTPANDGMERLWSRAVATGGNRWQMRRPEKRLR